MRRKDREIKKVEDILAIIKQEKVCRLAVSKNDMPYIIPLNYGYTYQNEKLTFYFHSAKAGKKLDIFEENKNVCIEIDTNHQLIDGKTACEYGYAYASVIAFGKVSFIETFDEKVDALNYLMTHQTNKNSIIAFEQKHLNMVSIYKVECEKFTGKSRSIPHQ